MVATPEKSFWSSIQEEQASDIVRYDPQNWNDSLLGISTNTLYFQQDWGEGYRGLIKEKKFLA